MLEHVVHKLEREMNVPGLFEALLADSLAHGGTPPDMLPV